MNLAKKYGHIIRVHPPESHGPDLQDLQNYKLSEELDNYVQTSMSSTKQKKNLYRYKKHALKKYDQFGNTGSNITPIE